jgi:hypothetical protein
MNTLILLIIAAFVLIKYTCNNKELFLNKNPYNNLETTHYKQLYQNKQTPTPEFGGYQPGHYKTYPDYYDNGSLLKSYWLGYSVDGKYYNDHKFSTAKSKESIDLKHPKHKLYHNQWLDYNPRPDANYIGYPFFFGGKHHR